MSLFDCAFAVKFRILRQVRLAVLAQEMQVDRIEDDPTLRRVLPDVGDVFPGKITTAQNYDIEFAARASRGIRARS